MHRFDIKTIQNVEIRRKTFKTTQTNESDQIIMHCIDLTSKRSKLLSYVAKLQNDQITMHCFYLMSKWSKQLKTTNSIKLRSICIDLTSKQSKTLRYGRKTFKTTQNYESDQIIVHCIDLTSKRSKFWVTSQNYKMIKL